MADFWKLVDTQYFPIIDQHKLIELDKLVRSDADRAVQQLNPSIPLYLSNLVDKVIKPQALAVSNDQTINELNKQNLIAGSYVSILTYGHFMTMANKRKAPCSNCLFNFEGIMTSKFSVPTPRCKTTLGVVNYLKGENKKLNKCVKMAVNGFCSSCLALSAVHRQPTHSNLKLKAMKAKLLDLEKRSAYFVNLITKRCKAEDKLKLAINISLEANLIQQYLSTYLIELEQKLLVDNIYSIVGKTKNFLIIEFIRIQGVYVINLNELKSWNKYRENSLFKVHKIGFKYYNPYYSFNVR